MIYSIEELIDILTVLKEDGYKTLDLLELLEVIGFEKKDLKKVAEEFL